MKIGSKLLNVAQRLAATMTDFVLVSLVLGVSLSLLALVMAHTAHVDTEGPFDVSTPGLSWTEGAALSLAPYFLVLLPLVWLIYEATLTRFWRGTTAGKLLFRVRTVSLKGNLSIWQCILRTTLKIMSVLLLLSIGHPLVLVVVLAAFVSVPVFTVKSQFIFDLMASTTVAKRGT
ncbi:MULTISPECIES: RDD family protein [Pseudomonas]|uniref:RDD domain-containing protein n=2 Tax=Pseudomonas TaxID=286 RepID=A0A6B7Q2M8_PSEPU|nr:MULTISPECIES: RDD family protein [Pseudomonas]MBA1203581.1 RDD family protein [Pseudomonas capeferrum]QFX76594.1 hypothetical protein [Pseudomonas putida]